MSLDHENDKKLAVLENEVKNIGIQLGHLNSYMECERRTRASVNDTLFKKLDDMAQRSIPAKDFEDLKKKWNGNSGCSGARLARWPS